MRFECKKADNCFSDAENYEYRTEMTGAQFALLLQGRDGSLRINEKLRRPTFVCTFNNGMQIKGLMEKTIIKVGFVPDGAYEQKKAFEEWLRGL